MTNTCTGCVGNDQQDEGKQPTPLCKPPNHEDADNINALNLGAAEPDGDTDKWGSTALAQESGQEVVELLRFDDGQWRCTASSGLLGGLVIGNVYELYKYEVGGYTVVRYCPRVEGSNKRWRYGLLVSGPHGGRVQIELMSAADVEQEIGEQLPEPWQLKARRL